MSIFDPHNLDNLRYFQDEANKNCNHTEAVRKKLNITGFLHHWHYAVQFSLGLQITYKYPQHKRLIWSRIEVWETHIEVEKYKNEITGTIIAATIKIHRQTWYNDES